MNALVPACRNLRALSLDWHYRSRHESLITFLERALLRWHSKLVTFSPRR